MPGIQHGENLFHFYILFYLITFLHTYVYHKISSTHINTYVELPILHVFVHHFEPKITFVWKYTTLYVLVSQIQPIMALHLLIQSHFSSSSSTSLRPFSYTKYVFRFHFIRRNILLPCTSKIHTLFPYSVCVNCITSFVSLLSFNKSS